MALKMPKVKIKPLNKMNVGDILPAAVGGTASVFAGPLGGAAAGAATKWAIDTYKGQKEDARTRSDARDAAARAESEATAARYEAERAPGRQVLTDIANTAVPGVSVAAMDPTFRNSQLQLLDQLTKQSQGQGPSLAQMQFKQAGNTALQKSMGAIRAATGTNAALGGRTAALAATNLLGNVAAESGMARLKEQQDAQAALAALAATGRTGDLQGRQQDIGHGATNAEIALKNLAARSGAAEGLLQDTGRMFEGHYNRGAQVSAAGKAKGGGDGLLPAAIGAAGGIIGSIYGGPAGGAAGGAAGKVAGEAAQGANLTAPAQEPMSLTGQAAKKPIGVKSSPFQRFRQSQGR